VRLHKRHLSLLVVMGVAVAVLPAIASSETPPAVNAVVVSEGVYPVFAWSPSPVTIDSGGAVTFSTGSTTEPHGIVWIGSVKPTCSSEIPVGAGNFRPHWSGSCKFAQAGTYNFHCSYHEYMTGTVVVNAAGVTTTTTTTSSTSSSTTTPGPTTPKPVVTHHSGNAKKLAKALKACKKQPKGKRAACRKRARKRFGPATKR
jgi:plastocyanin